MPTDLSYECQVWTTCTLTWAVGSAPASVLPTATTLLTTILIPVTSAMVGSTDNQRSQIHGQGLMLPLSLMEIYGLKSFYRPGGDLKSGWRDSRVRVVRCHLVEEGRKACPEFLI